MHSTRQLWKIVHFFPGTGAAPNRTVGLHLLARSVTDSAVVVWGGGGPAVHHTWCTSHIYSS